MSKVEKNRENCKKLGLEYSKDRDCPRSFPCFDKRLKTCSNTKGELLFNPFYDAKMFWTKAAYDTSKALDPKTSYSKTRRGRQHKEYADENFKNLMHWTDGKSLPSIEPSEGSMKGLRPLASKMGRKTRFLRLADRPIPIDEYVEDYYLEGLPESPSQSPNKGLETMEERIAAAEASPTHQAQLAKVRRAMQIQKERKNKPPSERWSISRLLLGDGTRKLSKKNKKRKPSKKNKKRKKTKNKRPNPYNKRSRRNK